MPPAPSRSAAGAAPGHKDGQARTGSLVRRPRGIEEALQELGAYGIGSSSSRPSAWDIWTLEMVPKHGGA